MPISSSFPLESRIIDNGICQQCSSRGTECLFIEQPRFLALVCILVLLAPLKIVFLMAWAPVVSPEYS